MTGVQTCALPIYLIQSHFQWLLWRYWANYKRDGGHVVVMQMIIALVKRDNLARQVRTTDVVAIQLANQVAEKLLGMSCDWHIFPNRFSDWNGPCIKAELSAISLVHLLVIKIHLDCCLARLNQPEIDEFRLKCGPPPRTWTNETCTSSPANSQSRFILIIKTEEWSSIASHRNCS